MACGPGRIGDWLVPDWAYGLDMRRCCQGHDGGYENPGRLSRKAIDKMFLVCLLKKIAIHEPKYRRTLVTVAYTYYWAVRVGGWVAWNKCRRNDAKGE